MCVHVYMYVNLYIVCLTDVYVGLELPRTGEYRFEDGVGEAADLKVAVCLQRVRHA